MAYRGEGYYYYYYYYGSTNPYLKSFLSNNTEEVPPHPLPNTQAQQNIKKEASYFLTRTS